MVKGLAVRNLASYQPKKGGARDHFERYVSNNEIVALTEAFFIYGHIADEPSYVSIMTCDRTFQLFSAILDEIKLRRSQGKGLDKDRFDRIARKRVSFAPVDCEKDGKKQKQA